MPCVLKFEVGVVMRDDGAFATPSSSPELGNFPGPFQQRLSSESLHSIPKTSFFRGEFLYGTYGRCVNPRIQLQDTARRLLSMTSFPIWKLLPALA